LKSDLSNPDFKTHDEALESLNNTTIFPTFDNRQVAKLQQSIYTNQQRYNPKRDRPQNHVLVKQT